MNKNEQNEEINFEDGAKTDGEELTMDDLATKFIKNPRVGESVVLPIAKIVVNKNVKFKSKDGVQINKSLSGVNFNWEILTTDGRTYTMNQWECVGRLKEICKQLGKTKGFTISIKHLKDGKLGVKGGNNYDVTLVSEKA
jgi:hypothetical protein